MKKIIFFISLLFFNHLFAQQKQLAVKFKLLFNDAELVIGKNYFLQTAHDSVRIDVFKMYVSNIFLFQDDSIVLREKESYHLLDADGSFSFTITATKKQIPEFNKIKFNLGIDSLTNTAGAMGGELDPTKGMYWTWQSGYVNFKLEGKSNACGTRDHSFQFHLGGYQFPFNGLQTIFMSVKKTNDLYINMDIGTFLSAIDIRKTNEVLSPGSTAVEFLKKAAATFSIDQ